MIYGYIYKITNTVNNKIYIGQTTKTVEARFKMHLNASGAKAKKTIHLYAAMNKYGKSNFIVEQIDVATSRRDLNKKERYWIEYYDAINNGYNMMPGGNDENPMNSAVVKEKHATKLRDPEVRAKISATLSKLRKEIGFSEEHRKKISEAQKDRKCFMKNGKRTYTSGLNTELIAKLLADGWQLYEKHSNQTKANKNLFATRSRKVSCLLDTGESFTFESILAAGRWWYEHYKPFGEVYSTATYQRKIEDSIAGKLIKCGNKTHKRYIEITNIKWFYTEERKVVPIYEQKN